MRYECRPVAYKNYRWIVADPDLLGGKLAIRGTRLADDPGRNGCGRVGEALQFPKTQWPKFPTQDSLLGSSVRKESEILPSFSAGCECQG